ncbi:hypothetical protein [Xanthobacter sp. 91]|uniref:hypothetical protein n=1 Tax=Xanthobacter sp. 91 TaxID=1117244 RepID=UPI0006911107|nr:hypothetical protein [Xanthobacter sp. 91]
MARIFAFLVVFISLLGAAPWLVPVAKESAKLIAARDDPAALADLGLRDFTGEGAARAIAAALAEDDTALATSYLVLADARHLAVPPDLRKQVEAANGTTAQALHSAKAFGMGFITGQPNDLAGLAGAATSDLMVWGDIRDAGREGLKIARGEEPDQLILGLSAVGIAVTAGTYATVGASLPVRMGISLVKVAKRTGRLSAGLLRSFTRAARESVDFVALRRLLSGATAVDGAAVKSVVRTDRLATLTRMLDDTARIEAKAGTRAALEGLKVAEGGRDLSRVARLADAKGGQTLAILKTLGRGAITITSLLFHLIWWGFLAAFYLFALVSSFNSFCVACARRTWRHKRRRREAPRVAVRGRLFVRRTPVVAPVAEVAMPATAAADVIAEATRDVLAATEAVRALGQEETGGELAGGEGPSSFPARAPERRAAPLLAVPREGPSCPISPPTVSISPISIRVPASRSS